MTIIDLQERRSQRTAPQATSEQLLELPSRFDIHQVPTFEQLVDSMLGSGTSSVAIDGMDVLHIDQAGIEALLDAADRADRAEVELQVRSSTTLRIALELVLGIPDASSLFDTPMLGKAA